MNYQTISISKDNNFGKILEKQSHKAKFDRRQSNNPPRFIKSTKLTIHLCEGHKCQYSHITMPNKAKALARWKILRLKRDVILCHIKFLSDKSKTLQYPLRYFITISYRSERQRLAIKLVLHLQECCARHKLINTRLSDSTIMRNFGTQFCNIIPQFIMQILIGIYTVPTTMEKNGKS